MADETSMIVKSTCERYDVRRRLSDTSPYHDEIKREISVPEKGAKIG